MNGDKTPRLTREFIDYHAFGMVNHLQKAGFTAYLVGGCVRDLLVGHMPKDFDIGTNALPQEVRRLISYAFIIGRRFRLVLVKRDDKQYEVATFRREPKPDEFPEGVPFGDNIFGTPEEDAFRRDFTCNALFYDPVNEKLIDYVDGKKDVENHIIRMIGDPAKRLREDSIRILRALRFAHKLHFQIEPELRHEMGACAETLAMAVLPRRREEFLKLLRLHDPAAPFRIGFDLGIWKSILPEINWIYEDDSRIEPFEDRLRRLETQLIDPSDTSLLAGALVLGWLRAHPRYHHEETFRHEDLFESKPLATLMKDNLGLHNAEIAGIIKALSLQKLLHNVEEFKKKGHRRKMSFLQSEAFPLALDLAHVDALLDPDTLEFWDTQLEILRTSGVEPGPEGAGPQHRNQPAHRRPRRRRRGPRKTP